MSAVSPHHHISAYLLGGSSNDTPLSPREVSPLYHFIQGLDTERKVLAKEDECKLQDPFANLILKRGRNPLSTNQLIQQLEKTNCHPNGLKNKKIFHIAEGGQIPASERTVEFYRSFRLAISINTKTVEAAIFISSGIELDSHENDQALHVMSWDTTNSYYNFYQRFNKVWIWVGNSHHAFQEETRHKGPFNGHINGGPAMKELHSPWSHWKSQSSGPMVADFFPSGHPFLESHLYHGPDVKGAEDFEQITLFAMHRWNHSRLEKGIKQNVLHDAHSYFAQILDTTNINLISSPDSSTPHSLARSIRLPRTFFANLDGFEKLDIVIDVQVVVSKEFYLGTLRDYHFVLPFGKSHIKGDTYFAFLVPEVAGEDIDLLDQMVKKKIISKHLAACLLMVDFANPIYSKSRAQLLQYMPKDITIGEGGSDLDEHFLINIRNSGKHIEHGSPEKEFFQYWEKQNWKSDFQGILIEYFNVLQEKISSLEGYQEVVRLAELRKDLFKEKRSARFDLALSKALEPNKEKLKGLFDSLVGT
ncbi:MAG: hypothetical protein ACHQUC_01470 [Chlamydiales bacterium]